jgi:hypothetical protein
MYTLFIFQFLMFMVHASHICDSLDKPHTLHLSIVTPASASVAVNPNNKG